MTMMVTFHLPGDAPHPQIHPGEVVAAEGDMVTRETEETSGPTEKVEEEEGEEKERDGKAEVEEEIGDHPPGRRTRVGDMNAIPPDRGETAI